MNCGPARATRAGGRRRTRTTWVAAVSALLLAGILVPLAGCLCATTMEVQRCHEQARNCRPYYQAEQAGEPLPVHAWTEVHAAAWPFLDDLLRGMRGNHAHAAWGEGERVAFWEYWGMDPHPDARNDLFLEFEGDLVGVRVLVCP